MGYASEAPKTLKIETRRLLVKSYFLQHLRATSGTDKKLLGLLPLQLSSSYLGRCLHHTHPMLAFLFKDANTMIVPISNPDETQKPPPSSLNQGHLDSICKHVSRPNRLMRPLLLKAAFTALNKHRNIVERSARASVYTML